MEFPRNMYTSEFFRLRRKASYGFGTEFAMSIPWERIHSSNCPPKNHFLGNLEPLKCCCLTLKPSRDKGGRCWTKSSWNSLHKHQK